MSGCDHCLDSIQIPAATAMPGSAVHLAMFELERYDRLQMPCSSVVTIINSFISTVVWGVSKSSVLTKKNILVSTFNRTDQSGPTLMFFSPAFEHESWKSMKKMRASALDAGYKNRKVWTMSSHPELSLCTQASRRLGPLCFARDLAKHSAKPKMDGEWCRGRNTRTPSTCRQLGSHSISWVKYLSPPLGVLYVQYRTLRDDKVLFAFLLENVANLYAWYIKYQTEKVRGAALASPAWNFPWQDLRSFFAFVCPAQKHL